MTWIIDEAHKAPPTKGQIKKSLEWLTRNGRWGKFADDVTQYPTDPVEQAKLLEKLK